MEVEIAWPCTTQSVWASAASGGIIEPDGGLLALREAAMWSSRRVRMPPDPVASISITTGLGSSTSSGELFCSLASAEAVVWTGAVRLSSGVAGAGGLWRREHRQRQDLLAAR